MLPDPCAEHTAAIKDTVYLYQDTGSSAESVLHTSLMLQNILPHSYLIKYINATEVIAGKWAKNAALFIMPGGADLGYLKKLAGRGNANIKTFVQNGGSYLGICAGAYYASAYVEFAKGSKTAILGARELAFFPNKAIGPVLANYNARDYSGARAADINIVLPSINKLKLYYNGGGYFEHAHQLPNTSVIGYYDNQLPAIIHVSHGHGQVILSGVHFEYNPSLLKADNPHLKDILPELHKDEISRQLLISQILTKLGIQQQKIFDIDTKAANS